MVSIYILINPDSGKVFYVGATQKPKSRLRQHCITHKPMEPEMVIVDEVKLDEAKFYESFYLDLFRTFGFDLPIRTPPYGCDRLLVDELPHPIDLKELKKPLLQICVKEDRSIPYLVRKAVKFWIENNYPGIQTDMK